MSSASVVENLKCSKCDADLRANARFCDQCGTSVSKLTEASQEANESLQTQGNNQSKTSTKHDGDNINDGKIKGNSCSECEKQTVEDVEQLETEAGKTSEGLQTEDDKSAQEDLHSILVATKIWIENSNTYPIEGRAKIDDEESKKNAFLVCGDQTCDKVKLLKTEESEGLQKSASDDSHSLIVEKQVGKEDDDKSSLDGGGRGDNGDSSIKRSTCPVSGNQTEENVQQFQREDGRDNGSLQKRDENPEQEYACLESPKADSKQQVAGDIEIKSLKGLPEPEKGSKIEKESLSATVSDEKVKKHKNVDEGKNTNAHHSSSSRGKERQTLLSLSEKYPENQNKGQGEEECSDARLVVKERGEVVDSGSGNGTNVPLNEKDDNEDGNDSSSGSESDVDEIEGKTDTKKKKSSKGKSKAKLDRQKKEERKQRREERKRNKFQDGVDSQENPKKSKNSSTAIEHDELTTEKPDIAQKSKKMKTEKTEKEVKSEKGADDDIFTPKQRRSQQGDTGRPPAHNTRHQQKIEHERLLLTGSGNPDELEVHFYAILDPTFVNADNMFIVLGHPVSYWESGPKIPVEVAWSCNGIIALHGKMHLSTHYKRGLLVIPYKYVKIVDGKCFYEYIAKPSISGISQETVNRGLVLADSDWQGRIDKFDNIVAPPKENIVVTFFKRLLPEKVTPIDLPDPKEFALCVKTFMPHWSGYGNSRAEFPNILHAQDAMISLKKILCSLTNLVCCDGNGKYMKQRYLITVGDRFQIFCEMFNEVIRANIERLNTSEKCLELLDIFISNIAITEVYIFSNIGIFSESSAKICKTLLLCFSLQSLHAAGCSQVELKKAINTGFGDEKATIQKALTQFILDVLQYRLFEDTVVFWSIHGLISLLGSDNEELSHPYESQLVSRMKKQFKYTDKDANEIAAVLHFFPAIKKHILSCFSEQKMEIYFRVNEFDVLDLLSAMRQFTASTKYILPSDFDVMLMLLLSRFKSVNLNQASFSRGIELFAGLFIDSLSTSNVFKKIAIYEIELQILQALVQSVVDIEPGKIEAIKKIFEKCIVKLMEKLAEKFRYENISNVSKFMDLFFLLPLSIDCLKKLLDDHTEKTMVSLIKKSAGYKAEEDLLQVFCAADNEARSDKMGDLFSEEAARIIDNISMNADHSRVFSTLSKMKNQKLLWQLCSKVIPNAESEMTVLKTLLHWPGALGCITLLCKGKHAGDDTPYPGKRKLTAAIDIFKKFEERLKSGEITREELEIVTQRRGHFVKISLTLKDSPKGFEEILTEAISQREKQSDFVDSFVKKLETLMQLCEQSRGIEVKFADLKEALARDIFRIRLSKLCKFENNVLKLTFVDLPEDLQEYLGVIYLASKCVIFRQTWEEFCQNIGEIELEDIVTSLYKPVVERLLKTVESLFEETISLAKLGSFFREFASNASPKKIQKELESLLKILIYEDGAVLEYSKDEIAKIAEKVCQVFKLNFNQKKASNVIKLGQGLGLKGNFDVFKEVEKTTMNNKGTQLKSLNDSHFQAADSVQQVTDEMEECISCMLRCMNLIMWLRDELKGLRDVKTFVDLLSISAGETDYEADRISCLHTVCLEFESIIFQLDVNSGPSELVHCCQTILKKKEKDPKLLAKLVDSNRFLEWFKRERESYGSVATSSMMEAEAANRRGYYVVGCSGSEFDMKSTVITLENSLHLFVPEQANKDCAGADMNESEPRIKKYDLAEIGDLQSKLMLIGGKQGKEKEMGQVEKDYFLQMFESVTRVANLYVELCNSGCYPYLSWNRMFECNISSVVGNAPEEVAVGVEEICLELEKDLEEWKNELHERRWEFPPLNHYTVRQLMMMQKELKDVITTETIKSARIIPPQIYTLLEEIDPNINQEVFLTVLHKSSYDRNYGETAPQDIEWRKVSNDEDRFSGITFENLEKFIEEVESQCFDDDAAKAATFICGTADKAKAILWCMENSENEDMIQECASKMDEVLSKKEQETQGSSVSEQDETESEEMKRDLEKGIEKEDFLTLNELGKFLIEIEKNRKRKKKKLEATEIMNKTKPSLMTVPKDDLLRVIIDIFKQTGNRLPVAGEVEICNRYTTLEEIELLFRRALLDSHGIYILAFIDELDHNISEQAYKKLATLLHDRTKRGLGMDNYNLLLMYASENEDCSFLAAAWDEYRVVGHRCPTDYESKEFLTRQFTFDERSQTSGYVFAAVADKERATIRVVKSVNAGSGKSLYIQRIGEALDRIVTISNVATRQVMGSVDTEMIVTISMQGREVNKNDVVKELLPYDKKKKDAFPRIYHFDIASTVKENLDTFLFELLVLGSVSTSTGSVWKKKPTDLYMIEITEPMVQNALELKDEIVNKKKKTNVGTIVPLLPTTNCRTPRETLDALKDSRDQNVEPGFDTEEFKSNSYQRVYQYLKMFEANSRNLDKFTFVSQTVIGDGYDCLRVLLRFCGVPDPSWREIKHFVHFFNKQLFDCENSCFCNPVIVGDTLPGFKTFVIKFMLMMSKDFATPSVDEASLQQVDGIFSLRRSWENSEHPYLFFNRGGETMSFLGFTVNSSGDLIEKGQCISKAIMSKALYAGLRHNGVELFSKFDEWSRAKKLEALCLVMGIDLVADPDPTYELTMDNVMKILAIHMRFRSGIPVILMGETGCGKTRLIRFMCKLKAGPGGPQNMLLVKVHGGVTENDIKRKVEKAIELAQQNRAKRRDLDTVLFFDEANTTSAIGMIKEIMCDKRMTGKPLNLESCKLQIIAACNPYRKHTDEMILRLESAGLGYHVKAEDASEKLGNIPLRQLVYRVHCLPESMLPLVWDFGQLSNETEVLYAAQIVHRYARKGEIPNNKDFIELVVSVLAASQLYMRQQQNECSFVSLRDVERAVQVLAWFWRKMDQFFPLIKDTMEKLNNTGDAYDSDASESISEDEQEEELDEKIRMSVSLALTVCYAGRLEKRDKYYKKVAKHFNKRLKLLQGYKQLKDDAYYCQQMFLAQLQLGENIAKNTALCENVFMMVVCIELRIPLFVVGKPGSSKSLAKTIVQDNMQGNLSHSDLFKDFKQILMCSYQCSPLSTADGIIATFRQCSRFQEGKNLETFASVVVLDEVGLAEDSPRMPLKALHPLLEDGTDGSEDLTVEGSDSKAKRVAFIGISNWALDPAKMNRGLMLTRGQPDEKELVISAEGICSSDPVIKATISGLFLPLAKAYLKIYKEQRNCEKLRKSKKEEFFGLRDYYSLIKAIFHKAKKQQKIPCLIEIEHAVRRNFGGLEDFDTWEYFRQELARLFPEERNQKDETVDVSPVGLLKSCLQKDDTKKDTRYLLLMTENYAALRVLEKKFPEENAGASVIFGSSFPKDQEFTQICRDINKIKVCMETGMTVVLLNMENLYESLYDALNQYYVYLGGQRYVDLGLGSHRVKCRVHEDFKLIVVAEKDTVYHSFPIPLINRLEKHFLVLSTSLTDRQKDTCNALRGWAMDFSVVKHGRNDYTLGDAFIGYNEDTPASVLLETIHELPEESSDDLILEESKKKLLKVATPEAITRLSRSPLRQHAECFWHIYFNEQCHSSLESFLKFSLVDAETISEISAQITTFSRLLSPHDQNALNSAIGKLYDMKCISLNQFQTEQQFSEELRRYIRKDTLKEGTLKEKLLIVQCDNGDEKSDLIASARHLCQQARNNSCKDQNVILHVIFIVNLKRVAKGCLRLGSFHGVNWLSIHIDELRPSSDELPSLVPFANHKMSFLFKPKMTDQSVGNDELGNRETSELPDEQENDSGEMQIDIEGERQESNAQDSNIDSDKLSLQLGLLKRCIQTSAVKSAEGNDTYNTSRVTKRIHLLLDLLSQKQTFLEVELATKFTSVLLKIIYRALLQKESQAIEKQDWFYDEAVTGSNIQECGTFRRALSYRIEKEIVPILTHVIHQVDRTCNLDILTEKRQLFQRIWIELYSCDEFLNLDYDELLMFRSKSLKKKKGGVDIKCWFPFATAVHEKITSIIAAHFKLEANNEPERIVRGALEQTSYGKLLLELPTGAVKAYLRDMVFIEFDVSDNVHELIASSVLIRAKKQIGGKRDVDILDFHLVLHNPIFRQRIDCFLRLSGQMPRIIPQVRRMAADAEDIVMDVLCLRNCITELLPEIEQLSDEQKRFIWSGEVQQMKLAANQLFHLYDTQKQDFTPKALKIFQDARVMWTRLQLMKIFVEHICPPGIPCGKQDIEATLELWETLLDIKDDMSSVQSWKTLENELQFLGSNSNNNLTREEEADCIICEEPLVDPVQLPCLHVTCYDCAHKWLDADDHSTCLVCHRHVSPEFKIPADRNKREMLYQLGSFKARCITFFMEAVSTFCFSSSDFLKNQELLDLMMSYATTPSHQTKQLSPFSDYGIDATPTVRSFLIQQLLQAKNASSAAEDSLQKYLQHSVSFYEDDIRSHLELCLLLVHCYEDFKLADLSKLVTEDIVVEHVCSRVERVRSVMTNHLPIDDVRSLQAVADARAVISKAAELAHQDIFEKKYRPEFQRKLHKMYGLLKNLCIGDENVNTRNFLLRQLLQRYGSHVLRGLEEDENFNWLFANGNVEITAASPDKFIIYGDDYRKLRDEIAEATMRGSLEDILIPFEDDGASSDVYKEALTLLCLYREVTTSISDQGFNQEFSSQLLDCLKSKQCIFNEKLAKVLLENKQGNEFEKLKCTSKDKERERELAELVVHTMIVLSLKTTNLLIQPLALYMASPGDMKNAFLPTMPDDHLLDVIGAKTENWKTYECPNGHIYVIGDCGRPVEGHRCIECNAHIGGVGYKLSAGNKEAAEVDRTQTGHVLGDPESRLDFPIPERKLNAVSNSLLSILVHCTLVLGACNDTNAVADMVHPNIQPGESTLFIWDHLRKSVEVFAKAIGHSVENAILFVHLVLERMLKEPEDGNVEDFGSLGSKECRSQWEDKFNHKFIQPCFARLENLLKMHLEKMVNDKRLGANPLMRHLYELDVVEDYSNLDLHAFSYVQFWRYRVPVTVTHLKFSLNQFIAKKGKSICKILQEFLDKEDVLRELKYLPEITKLQRLLSNALSQKLTSDSARSSKVKDIVKKHFKGEMKEKVNKLLKIYYSTWRALKPSLLTYGELARVEDFELSNNSPIGYLLPSKNDTGKRALFLLECLAEAHNFIVTKCRDVQGDQNEPERVAIQDANKFHLVAYDHDADLIPMLYAHCDYSLEIGKGTVIDYNFPALERQLVNTLIAGKPLVDFDVLVMKYADEVNNLDKFEQLTKRVEQREIPFAEQLQMRNEIHSLSEVCDALRAAEISMGLLLSTGADPNVFYKTYLEEVLRMSANAFLPSGKMQSVCRLTHIRSIWTMLTVERAFRFHESGQDPFELEDMFRAEVEDFDQQLLSKVDVDHLLAELTEYIVLEVPLRNESALEYPMKYCLEDFLDKKKSHKRNISGLDNVPDTICLEHIYSFWKVVANRRGNFKKQ